PPRSLPDHRKGPIQMIIIIMFIKTITTSMYTMKPRQIINFGAGVALIDPHQLNVKTTSDNTNQQH
ncbi:hypothetical protein, partial [Escherichia coli]|uniref:hypothetical protein n=2 Tax=Escherichia coli TaxID=562 RepID=UPI00063D514D